MSKILAIDFGLKRTGLAITDSQQILASPLETVPSEKLMDRIQILVQEESITEIVLGYPTSLDGSPTHITPNVLLLQEALIKTLGQVKVHLQNEQFSSQRAQQAIYLGGKKKQLKSKELIDKVSAAIILQDFLSLRNP
ncbi:MAG: Holliday junction resolvase RuvX [Flavobacteriales bacterium]